MGYVLDMRFSKSKIQSCWRIILLFLSSTFLLSPLAASADRARYDLCLAKVEKDARGAERDARFWQDEGGGPAAVHCLALALFQQKKYNDAANTLERLAAQLTQKDRVDKADVWAQAANAWLLAGIPNKALPVIDLAIAQYPNDPEFRLDRARIYAEKKDYRAALKDLDVIKGAGINNALVETFRAAALRHLKRHEEAAATIDKALRLDPNLPEALLERALIYMTDGNSKEAEKFLRRLLDQTKDGPAKQAAARYLKAIKTPQKN